MSEGASPATPPLPGDPRQAADVFSRAGLDDSDFQSFLKTWGLLPESSPWRVHWAESWTEILNCADRALAYATLSRSVEREIDLPGERRAELWNRSAKYRQGFIQLAGVSPALGEYLLRFGERFEPDAWGARWATEEELATRLAEETAGSGRKEFADILRRFKIVENLRIAYMDCVLELPVDRVTRQISTLADVLIQAAYSRARDDVSQRFGFHPPARGFSILALGKLGGGELNYSSDIDLNFIYDRDLAIERLSGGICDSPPEIEHFFTRLAESFIAYGADFTSEGQLYRLDMRLRPDSGTGRLIWSLRASIDYYYNVGRNWERQALIRQRHVAGDAVMSAAFREELQSFIFPSALTAAGLEEMRGLKFQIEKMASDQGGQESEIKIGQGGIRDVEYIVQYLQLVHGSKLRALRVANVFEVLEAMEREKILSPRDTDVLRRGYRFLRRVEHHLQLAEMLQTHRLPEDERALRRLARGLGFSDVPSFRGRLARHSSEIRSVFGRLFEQATRKRPADEVLRTIVDLPLSSPGEEIASLLTSYGLEDPEKAFTLLQRLSGRGESIVDKSHTKEVFRTLLTRLLRLIADQPEPDRTLSNFEDCVRSLGARSMFFQLLSESERILELFVDLCSRSQLVVEILRSYPAIFDEVVDCLTTGYDFDGQALREQVDEISARGGDIEGELRSLKYMHFLLTAIRDLQGDSRLRLTLQRVSETAEAVLHGILEEAMAEAERKMGSWTSEVPRFALLGLGKLGGREMTFRSDVDVVFLFEGSATTDRGMSCREYFERFSQIVLELCRRSDEIGPLLDVDLRLRPLGSHNSLMVSWEAWKDYFTGGPAETWERQAFLRARFIAGDTALGERAIDYVRREFVLGGVAGPSDKQTVLDEIWSMRMKLESQAGKANLKRGIGGIMDVEFLVQALQLLHGRQEPEILHANTSVAIENLQAAGVLEEAAGLELLSSYRFLRWVENRLSLMTSPGESLDSMNELQLEITAHKMGYRSTGEEPAREIFRLELEYHRRRNRAALLRALERDT